MTRLLRTAVLLAVLSAVVVGSAPAGPTDPPYPSRIDFPAPTVDPSTGAVTTNFSPEGMAVSGNTFYAGSTATGEIIKGNLQTGQYQRNWVPASPPQPSDLHRGILGLLVDDHNRLWAASSVGMACGGPAPQPACPAGTPSRQFNYGALFVYDGDTGAQLGQFTLTSAAAKTVNDITIANNAVFVANTTAPGAAGTEVQFELPLGSGGALPPSDTPPPGNTGTGPPFYANPAVVLRPTPGFTGADGIDTLPNGNVLFASITGTSNGQMISMDPITGAFTYITVTAADRPDGAPALLSLDGVALDGNMLYAPENRLDAPPATGNDTSHCPAPFNTLSCPGDWAAIHLDPPDYTHGEVITRLNSPPGSGLPPLRNPANMEQLGHSVYGITRVVSPNPTGIAGAPNVTQTFIERLDKVPLTATGSAVAAVEGASVARTVATFTDPNNGPVAGTYPQQGSSVYGYSATIDWGDGSTSTGAVSPSGGTGTFSISGNHMYAEEGSYPVTTSVKDGATGLTIATTTSTATVADAPLTAGPITTTCSAGSCSVTFAFTDANAAAPLSDFTATIDWGDGSTSAGTVTSSGGGRFVVVGTHPGSGGNAVTVTVRDVGGSTVSSAASPASRSMLVPNGNGAVNGRAQSVKVTVVATCAAGSTASAALNGNAVSNGETVRLKAAGKNGGSVRVNGDGLSITADSFQLVVTCTDAAGNQGTSVATWTFSP